MARLKEYFDLDFNRTGQWFTDLTLASSEGEAVTGKFRVHWDFDSGAKFISCYVPDVSDPLSYLFRVLQDFPEYLEKSKTVEMRVLASHCNLSSNKLNFTKRVILYYDGVISREIEEILYQEAEKQQLLFELRTESWAKDREAKEETVVFICHDSRDKDEIARPLAIELAKLACPVWFDEFVLQMGDSLREKIESGLKDSKKCVLIITDNFLSNEGWTKREFDSIFTREILMKERVVLPVWHNVTPKQVYEYSASLADKVARKWETGATVVAHEIRRLALAA